MNRDQSSRTGRSVPLDVPERRTPVADDGPRRSSTSTDLAVYYGVVPGRPRRRRCDDPPARDHRVHRPVGLRQDHGAALLQPDERPHPDGPRRGQARATTASTSTAPTCRPRRGAPAHRHGVPEAEPVPEVHLRQRRLRPEGQRRRGRRASSTTSSSASLRGAALWDEVKDRLKTSALGLSGGQQQRLCIARAIAVEPEVILMDEPCSALDPIATARIEDLMQEIKSRYTIVIVTHNMQQAARVSDRTAFFTTEVNPDERPPHRRARRVRPHREDLLQPVRRADRELRHRAVRMTGRSAR